MTQLKVSVLVMSLLVLEGKGQGQPTSLPVPPAPPSATRALVGHLVQGLYEGVAHTKRDTTTAVVVSFKSPPKKAPDPEAYIRFVTDTMVSELNAKKHPSEALSKHSSPDFVIRVTLHADLKNNLMRAQARLVRTPRSIWERLRSPDGTQQTNAAADAPLDLEIRTILGMSTASFPAKNVLYLRGSKLHHDKILSSPILAMRVNDYNDDRVPEVAFLQRGRLNLARYKASRKAFQDVFAHVELRSRARPSGSKLRDPIASLVHVVEGDGRTLLLAASSDYTEPLAFRLTREDKLRSIPLRVGGGAWPLYSLGVDGLAGLEWPQEIDVLKGPINELGVKNGSAMMSRGTLDGHYMLGVFPHWSINPGAMMSSAEDSSNASRVSWRPQTISVSTEYKVFLSDSKGGVALREQHGTVVCVADVNLDGEPEVLATSTSLAGDDTLTLYSKQEVGYVRIASVRLTKPNVRGRVTALAYGDINRDGRSEFLVASNDGKTNYLGIVEVKLTL